MVSQGNNHLGEVLYGHQWLQTHLIEVVPGGLVRSEPLDRGQGVL